MTDVSFIALTESYPVKMRIYLQLTDTVDMR